MKIFADWGTTNLRAWLVDEQGQVLERHSSGMGLRAASEAGFATVFNGAVSALGATPNTPAVLFGMVGSRKGWQEAAYCPTPVTLYDLASKAEPIAERPHTWLIGGVIDEQGGDHSEVMRGEEVQALGVLLEHPEAKWVCLPGTHSKWVTAADHTINGFWTFMTGELFEWAAKHSILSTQIDSEVPDEAGFAAGLNLAREQLPLTNALFQLRTRFLSGAISSGQVFAATSGLLIGYEVLSMAGRVDGPVYLCASASLTATYSAALEGVGLECRVVDPERATLTSLFHLSSLLDDDA